MKRSYQPIKVDTNYKEVKKINTVQSPEQPEPEQPRQAEKIIKPVNTVFLHYEPIVVDQIKQSSEILPTQDVKTKKSFLQRMLHRVLDK